MSAFETTLSVGGLDLAVPSEEALRNGVRPHVEVILAVVHALPFAQGPGQPPMMAHLGTVKYSIGRDQAVEFFKKGLEAAENLPAESKLEIATDIGAAEQAANAIQRMRADG